MNQHYFGPIPGASQKQLDQLAAIRVACQAADPDWDATSTEVLATRFLRWLQGSVDEAEAEVRRQVLLAVTANAVPASERDGDKARELVKYADQLYSRVHL